MHLRNYANTFCAGDKGNSPPKFPLLLTGSLSSAFKTGSFSLRQPSNLVENLITNYLLLADVAEKIPLDSSMGENMDPLILESGLAAYISLASW